MGERKIKTILFDLGNVIVHVRPEIIEKEYASYGRFNTDRMIEYVMYSDDLNKYQEGKLTSSQFYSKARRFFKLNIGFNDFYRIWNSMFLPYPEMEEIIKAIRKKYPDIKMVLLSNTNESHYEFIKREYPILDVLDAYVVSHEVGKQKPHPGIFKEALRVAGTLPKDTFYTDDRPELIDAARVMGIHAYQFVGHAEMKKQLAKFGVVV